MKFPSSYFEDEVREGFYVPGIMKRTWAAQLEVLEEIASVCERYNIRWFMDCGTLLGAIRHGGYIPWDDDLDICMLREDYDRFNQVAKRELPERYVVLNAWSDENFGEMLTRVTNGRHICMEREFLEKYHEFLYVVGIDIFPLDYVSPDNEEEEFRKGLIKIVNNIAANVNLENQNGEVAQRLVSQVEELCGVKFDKSKSLRLQLYKLVDQLFALYPASDATEVALMPYWVEKGNHKYPLECFEKTVMIPYETTELPAPAMYETVLKIEYGDYMRNVRSGGVHGYPLYKGQEAQLIRMMGGKAPYKYEFSEDELRAVERKKRVQKGTETRKEIVFLPYKASTWNAFESVWKAAMDDPDCDVYVVPIPYYDKKGDNTYGEMHYDADKYPSYVPITHYNEYDFEKRHPDTIFIQNPYDQCNYTTTVHPFFYAPNLKKFTDELVYIPPFLLEEINPGDALAAAHFCRYITMPGVVHADKVIVQSEQMRNTYIEALTAWAGEETRAIWEQKILGIGSPINDTKEIVSKDDMDMSPEWRKIMKKSDGSYKKVVLYNTSVSALLEYKEEMLSKIQEVLKVFYENREEIALLWRPHPLTRTTIEPMHPELWNAYSEIVEQYRTEGWGIYDDTKELDRAIVVCDAYYGDKSSIAQTCSKAGKPVMVQRVW